MVSVKVVPLDNLDAKACRGLQKRRKKVNSTGTASRMAWTIGFVNSALGRAYRPPARVANDRD